MNVVRENSGRGLELNALSQLSCPQRELEQPKLHLKRFIILA
jgi:hypothetical protein